MKAITLLLVGVCTLGVPKPASAYLKFGVRAGGAVIDLRWNRPIPYFVNERPVPGVGPAELRDAIARAFSTWQAVPTAAVQSQFQGMTSVTPGGMDGRTILGFLDRPDLERVLGATSLLLDANTGEILEADVFFNTRFTWSVAASGELGRTDLESVALHEIGHLLGLGHSALGETEMIPGGRQVLASGAVMFPIALTAGSIGDRELQPDDRAGISDIYPRAAFETMSSSISGRVTKNGNGVFGAHVVAFSLETGALVGGFSLNARGEFVIAALTPGAYLVRVEPLDDADPSSFFEGTVDVDFRVVYGSRVVIAPEGGSSDPIELQVAPK